MFCSPLASAAEWLPDSRPMEEGVPRMPLRRFRFRVGHDDEGGGTARPNTGHDEGGTAKPNAGHEGGTPSNSVEGTKPNAAGTAVDDRATPIASGLVVAGPQEAMYVDVVTRAYAALAPSDALGLLEGFDETGLMIWDGALQLCHWLASETHRVLPLLQRSISWPSRDPLLPTASDPTLPVAAAAALGTFTRGGQEEDDPNANDVERLWFAAWQQLRSPAVLENAVVVPEGRRHDDEAYYHSRREEMGVEGGQGVLAVLELGCGCGVVGLTMADLVMNQHHASSKRDVGTAPRQLATRDDRCPPSSSLTLGSLLLTDGNAACVELAAENALLNGWAAVGAAADRRFCRRSGEQSSPPTSESAAEGPLLPPSLSPPVAAAVQYWWSSRAVGMAATAAASASVGDTTAPCGDGGGVVASTSTHPLLLLNELWPSAAHHPPRSREGMEEVQLGGPPSAPPTSPSLCPPHTLLILSADVIYSSDAVGPILQAVAANRDAFVEGGRRPGREGEEDSDAFVAVHWILSFLPRSWTDSANATNFRNLCRGALAQRWSGFLVSRTAPPSTFDDAAHRASAGVVPGKETSLADDLVPASLEMPIALEPSMFSDIGAPPDGAAANEVDEDDAIVVRDAWRGCIIWWVSVRPH